MWKKNYNLPSKVKHSYALKNLFKYNKCMNIFYQQTVDDRFIKAEVNGCYELMFD